MTDSGDHLINRLAPYLLLVFVLLILAIPQTGRPPLSEGQNQSEPRPPTPPILETFQGAPQLSLFPRLGDFRPEDGEDRLPFWKTYREHLLKISGVVKEDPVSGNMVFTFRGIKGIDSIGHFAPLAVEPEKSYRVRLKINASLPEGASTGIGVLQYSQFLWLGEQYPQSLHREIFLASNELLRINRTEGWQDFDLRFTTGSQTRMIHLVLFREGPATDRAPVLVDNISVME